jgi:hypothetical protein
LVFSTFSVLSGRSQAIPPTRGEHASHHYDPNQPRMPAGHPDGGQWMRVLNGRSLDRADGSPSWILASSEPPRRSPGGPPKGGRIGWALAILRLFEAIHRYLEGTARPDLFGNDAVSDNAVVAATSLNGELIVGTSSRYHTYTLGDHRAARRMRAILIRNRPDVMKSDNIGHHPNDTLFHAEATVLLRAARANGGTLAGRHLEVAVNGAMCMHCKNVLPHLGLELGNPTVTFTDRDGLRRKMHDGEWVEIK